MSRATPRVSIRCTRCGEEESITDRQKRRKESEGRPHVCYLCRNIKVKPPTQSDYNYWTSRYSEEEIREMGAAIWG